MRVATSLPLLVLVAACAPGLARAQAPATPNADALDLAASIAVGPALTAERAAERAVESAPSIERAEALTRASQAAVARSRDQLLPRLDLSARYAHIDGFPDGRIGFGQDPQALAAAQSLALQITDPSSRELWVRSLSQQAAGQVIKIPRDQAALSARLSWPVSDLFFAVAPSIKAAEAAVRVNAAQHEARAARVRLSARESFYALARARGALAVAERALAQALSQQARIDSAVKAGLRPPADAASAAARVASAEQATAAGEAGVDVADAALRTLLGDADGPTYGIAEPVFESDLQFELAPAPELIERARARRPELRALHETIAAQRKTAEVHAAGGYPHLGVYAGADYAMPNRYVIPPASEFQPSWEVGATLSYAPNDTLAASRRRREDAAQIEALEADLHELERGLQLEVRQARAALARSGRTVEAARAAQTAAQAAYERRLAELHAGEVTSADLFAAESELNTARLAALDASVEQLLARARLAYATGE